MTTLPILNVREDDLSGLEDYFRCHLRGWPFSLQFFEPVQDDIELLGFHDTGFQARQRDDQLLTIRGDVEVSCDEFAIGAGFCLGKQWREIAPRLDRRWCP